MTFLTKSIQPKQMGRRHVWCIFPSFRGPSSRVARFWGAFPSDSRICTPGTRIPEKRKKLFFVLFFPGSGRKNSDKKILTKNFGRKNSDEKIPTKKFRRNNSDEKIPTKKFGRKNLDEKKLGARHGGKARPLRRQGTGN